MLVLNLVEFGVLDDLHTFLWYFLTLDCFHFVQIYACFLILGFANAFCFIAFLARISCHMLWRNHVFCVSSLSVNLMNLFLCSTLNFIENEKSHISRSFCYAYIPSLFLFLRNIGCLFSFIEKENLCLYGHPDETWEVNLPAEEVPPELPEPALGINFPRDGLDRRDWLSLVAVHSDVWLLAVSSFYAARFDRSER